MSLVSRSAPAFVALGWLLLAGCAAPQSSQVFTVTFTLGGRTDSVTVEGDGREFDASRAEQIVDDKTTSAEILKLLGPPYSQQTVDSLSIWTYFYGTPVDHKELVLIIENEKVSMHEFTHGAP